MNVKDLKILADLGFTLFFAGSIVVMLYKFMPQLILSWNKFTRAIEENTAVTQKHFSETVTLKDELIILKKRLETHDDTALSIKDDHAQLAKNQDEILKILREMQTIVMKKWP